MASPWISTTQVCQVCYFKRLQYAAIQVLNDVFHVWHKTCHGSVNTSVIVGLHPSGFAELSWFSNNNNKPHELYDVVLMPVKYDGWICWFCKALSRTGKNVEDPEGKALPCPILAQIPSHGSMDAVFKVKSVLCLSGNHPDWPWILGVTARLNSNTVPTNSQILTDDQEASLSLS